jgi:hypothetical protein
MRCRALRRQGDLVWIEQPANIGDEWVERQLTGLNGPGVAFELVDLNADGSIQVVAAQVRTRSLCFSV